MYIELHCRSAFSFLDGASLPEQLALTASQLGYPALALTDHNGLYGSMAFAQESQKLGLQAITGAELTLLDDSHVTVLAETPEGYANLCRLITEAHLGRDDRRDPRLDFASSEANSSRGSRRSSRPRWASVIIRQRFAYPSGVSASSVTWEPSSRVSSAPVIAWRPSCFASCANAIEPYSPWWSVSASAGDRKSVV